MNYGQLMVGSEVPNFKLPTVSGDSAKLSDFRGKRVALFMWASWWVCRNQLPVWQDFYSKYRSKDIEVVSVAVDAQGSGKVQPYLDLAGATFVTLIDESNLLSSIFGFKAVPNGLLIDEYGILNYQKYGGFELRKPE